jgi:hypothetical protein
MNRITLSTCGRFVELWNNGNRIWWTGIGSASGDLHQCVGAARDYIRKWAGDDSPEISKELRAKMADIDAMICRLAFAGEWR